ncbi:putative Serine/threonine-protein phosphatase [Monocercomonoides exilis]|uniref:putative Serine/threonine-protein phosphatase n=1 Tax=Monocercomonoides exilis TaxID=2049356 RepID=UPI00355AAE5A|nr:putative Serine/threonine-protein phosphatase [Monocercomonoides exilis]|eukprot:MONOS_11423.1-p1 / transcript=MONOS_11423.1 / gene=MONOS_11423 / organism=Monocercomonoides_exilis_PA203 / gene_product=Serine/threonine-protein phosphatase / transcript_product=Serine/threonine-protein phosphatase / location=Mono_scaffold00572:38479-40326(+) / protein_length=335 / sequence_SO=supercontig / SO=protein_coding / is_pseudo=false
MARPLKKTTSKITDPLDVPTPVTQDYVTRLLDALKAQKRLSITQANCLLAQARKTLEILPNILEINVPEGKELTVVGDTHGQFYDLLNLFEKNGMPSPENPYLINGDFVDRGSFGTEICFLLFALKIASPDSIHLLRGNHESATCTADYGFRDEVHDKYNPAVYQNFLFVFNALPLCAVINKSVFVVHGGLFTRSPVKLSEIKSIDRFHEPGEEGGELLMAQMLWSDPCEARGYKPTLRPFGCSFGPDVTAEFLAKNDLERIIRSHEVRQQGYSMEHGGKLITVFSAPCYCDERNKGGFLRLCGESCEVKFLQFDTVPHPACKMYFDQSGCRGM